jgi:hypothetical protein
METNFKADEFLKVSPAERVEICRLMAREALSLSAGNGSQESRKVYADLATKWSFLGDEIARHSAGH